MSSTTTRSQIGAADIEWYDGGSSDTFTRKTSTGGDLTLNKVGYAVDVAEAYGSGTASGAALGDAVSAIGSTNVRKLILKPGTWTVDAAITIPANLTLAPMPGAILAIATGITLTINGPIEAGPYQIFSWAGTGIVSIKGSPTVDCPIEWWGGVTGITEDNAAVFNKVDDCINNRQNIRLGPGVYRIASSVTWLGNTEGGQKMGFGLVGVGQKSVLMIDVGAAVGLTLGATATQTYSWRLQNFYIAAEAASCTNALVIYRSINSKFGTLWFAVGSTGYAVIAAGCEHNEWDLQFGTQTQVMTEYGITYGTMANALSIVVDGTYKSNSFNRLKFTATGTAIGTYGINANGCYDNWHVTGCIENTTTPIYVEDCYGWNFENIHLENNTNGVIVKNSKQISFTNVHPKNASQITYVKGKCSGITFKNSILYGLTVYPGCYGVVLDNTQLAAGGLTDLSGCVEMRGTSSRFATALNYQMNKYGQNKLNYFPNTSFLRWQADCPDGLSKPTNTVYTKCGTGEADTTKPPHATYSAEAVTATGAGAETSRHTLSTETIQAVLGECVVGSIMAMLPSGQTFTDDGMYLVITPTIAAWVAGTAYAVGEAVLETGSDGVKHFVCIDAGTSHAVTEPTWLSYAVGDEVTDNDITWVSCERIGSSIYGFPMKTAQSDGLWHKVCAGPVYVPTNSSAVYMDVVFYDQTAGDGTCYIGEPGLWIGSTPSRGLHYGHDEHYAAIYVGGNKMSWGAAVPGVGTGYHKQGDVRWNTGAATGGSPGWVCITSGEAAAAVWETMAVTVPIP